MDLFRAGLGLIRGAKLSLSSTNLVCEDVAHRKWEAIRPELGRVYGYPVELSELLDSEFQGDGRTN